MHNKNEVADHNTKLSGTAIVLATYFKNKPFKGPEIMKALGVDEATAKEIFFQLGAYCFLGKLSGKEDKYFIILNPDQRINMIKRHSDDIREKIKTYQDAVKELEYLSSAIFSQKLML